MTDLNPSADNNGSAPYWAPSSTSRASHSGAVVGPFVPPAVRGRGTPTQVHATVGTFLSNEPSTVIIGSSDSSQQFAEHSVPDADDVVASAKVQVMDAQSIPWIDSFLASDAPASDGVANEGATNEAATNEGATNEGAVNDAPTLDAHDSHHGVVDHASVMDRAASERTSGMGTGSYDTVRSLFAETASSDERGADDFVHHPSVEQTASSEPAVEAVDADSHHAHAPLLAHESQPVAQSSVDEVWPLEEAGQEMSALANELQAHEEHVASQQRVSHDDFDAVADDAAHAQSNTGEPNVNDAQPASPLPLPMWHDEEWMDIMPVSPPPVAENAPVAERPWADVAREAATRRAEIESAATALEGLALRVRTGELRLPGYQPELGDAAALAAALAALLGIRR